MELSAPDRQALAAELGIHEQYLYQCLTGRKDMRTDEAVRIERDSNGRLRRWHLRKTDWWKHWPELIGSEGAPEIPTETVYAMRMLLVIHDDNRAHILAPP